MIDTPNGRNDDAWAAAESLAESIRQLIGSFRIADFGELDPETIADLATSIDAVTGHLAVHEVDGPRAQFALRLPESMDGPPPTLEADPSDASISMPYSPVNGRLNPLAPPVRIQLVGNEAVGSVTFDAPYNGPPGSVHGGILAATFDEVLGAACFLQNLGAFTGTLTIRYRKTTPLGVPLQLRGRVIKVEGRKVFAEGEATDVDGSTLYAEAEGIFIRARQE